MSQVTRRTRVRQLADSVWPGRTVDGYANLIAARLRKLAAVGSTGVLPVSGRGDGVIFFRGGQVVYAESSRTPTAVKTEGGLTPLGLLPTDARGTARGAAGGTNGTGAAGGTGAELMVVPSLARLTGLLALTERTVDAVTDLLSSESRYGKFRPSDVPPAAQAGPNPVDTVLTEVERRRQILRQLAPVVTSDTPVVRDSSRDSPCFQVSAPQWALLVRVGDVTTPRALAMALDHSVFGTTIEVYRLFALGLLAVPGRPPGPGDGGLDTKRSGETLSFMRAVSALSGGEGRRSDA